MIAAHFHASAGLHDFTAELDDMARTAALIDELDLVVCVGTSVATIAAALGNAAGAGYRPVLGARARRGTRRCACCGRRGRAVAGEWGAEIAQACALVGGGAARAD